MPNTIIYQASTTDAVHGCAYSLLKYLSVYNMKPPADHVLKIYTNNPASLEMYGSLFSSFELKEPSFNQINPSVLPKLVNAEGGNVLYMASNAYPTTILEPMFQAMSRGDVFIQKNQSLRSDDNSNYSVIGYGQSSDIDLSKGHDPSKYISNYNNLKEFNSFLNYFFKRYQEESVPNQVKLIQSIDARKIEVEKMNFQKLPAYTRLWKKISGKAWNIQHYTGKF